MYIAICTNCGVVVRQHERPDLRRGEVLEARAVCGECFMAGVEAAFAPLFALLEGGEAL